MFNKRQRNFIEVQKRLFNTPDGMEYLKYLEEMYVHPASCVSETPELTYYKLAQKEFVLELIKIINDKELFNEVILPTIGEE